MLQWIVLFGSIFTINGFSVSEYSSPNGEKCLNLPNNNSVEGARPELVLFTTRDWLSHCVATVIARIIVEEVAGLNASFVPKAVIRTAYMEPEDLRCRGDASLCQEPEFASDVDMESWRVVIGESFHRNQILQPNPPIPIFPIGYNGVSGLYYTPKTLEQNASQAFDFYKRYLADEVLSKFPVSGTVNVTEVFSGDLQSKDYCGQAWNLAHPVPGRAWCTNGRFVPSHCDAPPTPCRELYHYALDWDSGWIEQIIQNNGLPFTVSYVKPTFVQTIKTTAAQIGGVVFYWYEPDPLVSELNAQRIQFPRYYPGCWDGDTQSPAGTVKCDYKDKVLYKLLSPRLRQSLSLVYYVLDSFRLTSDDIRSILSTHQDAFPGGGTCWNISCNYVKQEYTKLSALAPKCIPGVEKWSNQEMKCKQICKPHEVGEDCHECAPGWVPDWQQVSCEPCKLGQYTKPNHTYNAGDSCDVCPVGRYQGMDGQSHCNLCAVGTAAESTGSTACERCDRFGGVDLYAARLGQKECIRCPEGATCPPNEQGYRVEYFSLPGWYRMSDDAASDQPGLEFGRIWQCPNNDKKLGNACLGYNQCANYSGEVSMEGAFCGRCRKGFAQTSIWFGNGICKPCQSGFSMFLWIGVGELLVFGTIAVNSLFHLSMDHLQPMEVYAVVLKQLMNYSQMLMVVMDVVVFHNFDATDIVGWSGFLSASPMETVASKDCLYLGGDELSVQYRRVIMAFFELPFYLCGSILFFALGAWIQSKVSRRRMDYKQAVPVVVISLFVIQPRLTRSFLSIFQCAEFDTPRLMLDLSVDCESNEHLRWETISILGFVFYSLGIPVVILLMLLSVRENLESLLSRQKFGFLYNGFEPKYYYFEVVYILRKVLFQVGAVLPRLYERPQQLRSNENMTRVMALLMISVAFLAIHISYRPFDNRAGFILDSLESAGLWAITITLLMKSFTSVSDNTVVFASDSARKTRDTVAVIFLLLFHLNFFRLAVWGLVRPIGLKWIQTLHRTRLRGFLNFIGVQKEEKFIFEPGILHLCNLSNKDRFMLGTTLAEMIEDQVENTEAFCTFKLDEYVTWCCTEARLMREKMELARLRHLKPLRPSRTHSKVSQVTEGSERMPEMSATFSDRSSSAPQSLGQSFFHMLQQVWYHFRYVAIDQIETVPPELFQNRENIEMTFGQSFKVEELQVSIMRTRSCLQNRKTKGSGSTGSRSLTTSKDFAKQAEEFAKQGSPDGIGSLSLKSASSLNNRGVSSLNVSSSPFASGGGSGAMRSLDLERRKQTLSTQSDHTQNAVSLNLDLRPTDVDPTKQEVLGRDAMNNSEREATSNPERNSEQYREAISASPQVSSKPALTSPQATSSELSMSSCGAEKLVVVPADPHFHLRLRATGGFGLVPRRNTKPPGTPPQQPVTPLTPTSLP